MVQLGVIWFPRFPLIDDCNDSSANKSLFKLKVSEFVEPYVTTLLIRRSRGNLRFAGASEALSQNRKVFFHEPKTANT